VAKKSNKKRCFYRIKDREGDFYGGTRAEALQRQKELQKSHGVRGRLYKHCVDPSDLKGKSYRQMSPVLQWGLIGAVGIGAYLLLRKP
jgi:hypothetical protein